MTSSRCDVRKTSDLGKDNERRKSLKLLRWE